jgi:hypothetical protein
MVRQLLDPFVIWSDRLAAAQWVRGATWVFPILEVVHLLGLILLFGSAGMFALRCWGLVFHKDSVVRIGRDMGRVSLAAAAVMIATGYLMFASGATKYADNQAFQYKMALLFAAVVAQGLVYARVARARADGGRTLWVVIGSLLLLLWVSVGVAGRAIAFL